MTDVKITLKSRGQVYGDYNRGIQLEADIMKAITTNYFNHHNEPMPADAVVAVSKIVMKLSRLSVSPYHLDSWHDIAGYATLFETYIINEEDKNA